MFVFTLIAVLYRKWRGAIIVRTRHVAVRVMTIAIPYSQGGRGTYEKEMFLIIDKLKKQ